MIRSGMLHFFSALIICLIFLTALSADLHAQATRAEASADGVLVASKAWRQTSGPVGGGVTAFASTGTRLFCGTWGGGLYRSADAGATWNPLKDGLPANLDVVDLVVTGGVVFAGTADAGVFRSFDDGTTWSPANTGLGDVEVLQLVSRNSDLFILIGDLLGADLYVSRDLGATWEPIASPTPFTAMAAAGPAILANSAFAIGIYRTTDDGLTWELLPPNGLTTNILDEFAVVGTTVYGALMSFNPGSVYMTADFGDNWIELEIGVPNIDIEGLGVHGNDIFVISSTSDPLYRSTDGGANWERADCLGLATGPGRIINRIGSHGTFTYAGTEKGVFRSTDLGDNWQEVNENLIATRIQDLAFDGSTLYATVAYVPHGPVNSALATTLTMDTVFRSSDGGRTWQSGNAGLPAECKVKSLAVKDSFVFAGTVREGVYRSADGGISWTPARNGLPEPYFAYGEIDHLVATGSSLFAATRPRSVGSGRTQGGGVYRSDDNGVTWFAVNDGIPLLGTNNPPYSYQYYPYPTGLSAQGSTLLFGTKYEGVFRSIDNGATWTEANTGLPTSNDNYPRFTSFVRLGSDVYASSHGFHAGIDDARGVFRSSDGGASWTHVGIDLADSRPVNALAVQGHALLAAVGCPAQPHDLAACPKSASDGVYRSVDGGVTWTRIGTHLDGISVARMHVRGSRIFAGTLGYGIWR